MTINLKEMTTEEKLQAMELLWDDLCRKIPESLSPQWHADVLKEREERIKEGQEGFRDWDEAKARLRESLK
jgi:hypothetical protein